MKTIKKKKQKTKKKIFYWDQQPEVMASLHSESHISVMKVGKIKEHEKRD